MYTRLDNNRTKKYYREIINSALLETEKLLKMSPEIIIYQSIYNQLADINEKIIKNHIIFSEDELYNRYSLGALAVKNFDLDNDEYAQKLSDSFGGTFDYNEMKES
ncbi:immunity protein Tsi6 family protein [Chryseobacterium sp.]|uniref:immunity protein Tsi6 family protein n=1 Tax=Chryseobacterium sp. TaxID=1871047 RepID=UPI00289A5423|nr:immunity protein Tsi6 family protein [Chryseobacterium sp.]